MNIRTTIMSSATERDRLVALAAIYRGDKSAKMTLTETVHRAVGV